MNQTEPYLMNFKDEFNFFNEIQIGFSFPILLQLWTFINSPRSSEIDNST